MTAVAVRAGHDDAIPSHPPGVRAVGDLEVPRPLRLLLTASCSVGESAGLPMAAYLLADWAAGRSAGMIAGLAAIWLTTVIRKVMTGSVPSLLTISAAALTVQTAVVLATGELWLFLLQFPLANLCMGVLFARTASGQNPLVAKLAAEVVALRQPATHYPGLHRFFQGATWLWAGIFLLLTAGLAVLMVTEPTGMFLTLSTAATVVLVVAGTSVSTVWFLWVLRRLGLRLRFAPAVPLAARSRLPRLDPARGESHRVAVLGDLGAHLRRPLDERVSQRFRQPHLPGGPVRLGLIMVSRFGLAGVQPTHRDQAEPEVADLGQQPVQGGLVSDQAANHRLLALAADLQAAEPRGPPHVQDTRHADLIPGRPAAGAPRHEGPAVWA